MKEPPVLRMRNGNSRIPLERDLKREKIGKLLDSTTINYVLWRGFHR